MDEALGNPKEREAPPRRGCVFQEGTRVGPDLVDRTPDSGGADLHSSSLPFRLTSTGCVGRSPSLLRGDGVEGERRTHREKPSSIRSIRPLDFCSAIYGFKDDILLDQRLSVVVWSIPNGARRPYTTHHSTLTTTK